jgi:hypothetical protein
MLFANWYLMGSCSNGDSWLMAGAGSASRASVEIQIFV